MNEPARAFQAILAEALQLPAEQQAHLAEALLHALGPSPELDLDELDRRDAELLEGRTPGLTLQEFETALHRHLDQLKR
jgi:hypothetical protein